MTVGTRAQVWHGTAKKTSGGLMKSNLLQNKNGRIVSKSKHNSAKKDKRLVKAGYLTKKGKFGFVKSGTRKMRKMRGGAPYGSSLSPTVYDGQGVGTSGVDLQIMATTMGGKRRRRGKRGGAPYGSAFAPEVFDGVAGQGITPGGPQTIAELAGGKKRRHGKRHGKRGGTTDANSMGMGYASGSPQLAVLNAD